jgi:hypothetical protein
MQTPKLAQDLGRDLRDKRLLPVIGLLVVAILAVPFLLGGGSEPVPPPTGPSSSDVNQGSAADAQAEPVVLADVPGIRDYQKRLAKFQKRNPFKQQFTGGSESSGGSLEDTTPSGGGLSGGGSEAESSGSSSTSSDSTSGGNSGGNGSGGNGSGGREADQGLYLYSYEIDAKITVDGKTEKLESVKQLEFLPGNKTPVLQFLKGDFEQKSAAFVVSPRVTETRGEGKCSPNNSSCEFLLLKDGESHSFDYEPDGRTYRIRLTRVKRIDTRVDPDDVAGEELRNSAGSLSGLLAIR